MEIIEVTSALVGDALDHVLKYHISFADTLQIASIKLVGCDRFLTSDRRLNEVALLEDIKAILL